jgi:hypothetical protein
MILRPPRGSTRDAQPVALDYEIAQEQANALGRLGRALERALAALSHYDSSHCESSDCDSSDCDTSHYDSTQPRDDSLRAQLAQNASEALWCFIVQREACGLRDPRPVLRDYRVPAEVYARMGIFARR